MEYRNLGIRCKCGGETFNGDFVRQPGIDDVLSCAKCGQSKTCEMWVIDAQRRAKAEKRRLLKGLGKG